MEKTDPDAVEDMDLRQTETEGLESTCTQAKRPSPWEEGGGDPGTEPQLKIARPNDLTRLMTQALSKETEATVTPLNSQDSLNKVLTSASLVGVHKEKTDKRMDQDELGQLSAESSKDTSEIQNSDRMAENQPEFQEVGPTEGSTEANANIFLNPDGFTVLASDFESTSCLQCGEEFDMFCESEGDEWRLRDALAANDSEGKPGLFHPTCHEDYLALLARQAATATESMEANTSSHRTESIPVLIELELTDSRQQDNGTSESSTLPNIIGETRDTEGESGQPPPRRRGKAKRKTESKKPENPKFWTEGALTRDEVSCTICLGIFLEPVSLPCKHTICLECYRKHVDVTSLYCPICRFRLSVWSRRASKENSLINLPFWERIQQQFPEPVADRTAGIDAEPFASLSTSPMKRDGTMAAEGEILHEFKAGLEQFQQEMELERRKEEEASNKFILQLQKEEPPAPPPQSPSQLQADFELARKLQEAVERQAREGQQHELSELRSGTGQGQEENEASLELIRRLQEEPPPPPPQSPTQLQADFEFAKRLQEEADKEERKKRKEQSELRRSFRKATSVNRDGRQNNRKT